jgi:tetratricopeptide (TPR) repeat protein
MNWVSFVPLSVNIAILRVLFTTDHAKKRMLRAVLLPILALLAFAGSTRPAPAQGPNHRGGNGVDAIRCTSGKPEVAIIACSKIIEDQRENADNRAIALRNRAFRYQQLGDSDRAIADYTTALKHPEQPGVRAKTYLNRGLMYFRRSDDAEALADYNEAVALERA